MHILLRFAASPPDGGCVRTLPTPRPERAGRPGVASGGLRRPLSRPLLDSGELRGDRANRSGGSRRSGRGATADPGSQPIGTEEPQP